MSPLSFAEATSQGRRWWRTCIVAIFFALPWAVTACTGTVGLHDVRPAVDLAWPPRTDGPSIVWVKSISGRQDAGVTRGFWRRALDYFSGDDDRVIVRPYGVLYDARDRLFITDPGAGVVHVMDIGAGLYSVIGEELTSPLKSPIGVAEDADNRLYITDSTTGMVYRYNLGSDRMEPLNSVKFRRPTGIAYNSVNRLLYVVDTLAPAVICLDETGAERFRFGSAGSGPDQFNRPTDIAIDRQGQVFVTDALNYRIKVFTPEGKPVTQFGTAGDAPGDLTKPKGVAVDSEGHIYVSDALQDAVQVFDDSGRLLTTLGGGTGRQDGEFWMPSGVSVDGHDYIFVADTYNRRVQVFRYAPGTRADGVSVRPDTEKSPPGKRP